MTDSTTWSKPPRKRLRVALSRLWALSPLLAGITTPAYLLLAARKLRSRVLAVEAGLVLCAVVVAFILAASNDDSLNTGGGFIFIGLMLGGTSQAFVLRRQIHGYTRPVPATTSVAWAPPVAGPGAAWDPNAFPKGQREYVDPMRPNTWATPFDCDGRDSHDVTTPPLRLLGLAFFGGAVSVATALYLHFPMGAFSAGIGLILTPLIAASSRQQIEGPVFIYRRGWRRRRLRLDTATEAHVVVRRTRKGGPLKSTGLYVLGPDAPSPVKISVGAFRPGISDLRAHLAGWLLRDGVTRDSGVERLLHGELSISPPVRRRTRVLVLTMNSLVYTVILAGLLLQIFVFRPSGPATSASSCLQSAPPGASPTARQYLADLNASDRAWVAVSNTLAHNDLLTPEVLERQSAADQAFVTSINKITFDGPVAPVAADYANRIDMYDQLLRVAAQDPSTFNGMRPTIHPLNQARESDAAQMRTDLGLPSSQCAVIRPL